jgi:TonB-linked SusC/RagA family outer membrane protein
VKGSERGTMTGADGSFNLKGVSPGVILLVSYAGFVPKEVRVDKSTEFSLVLTPSNSPLDEVKVIAYGTTTDRLNTGDVTTIKSEDIEKQPVSNPLLALEGRVPGLFITQTTGFPGGGVQVLVQGQNSIGNGSDPFYVIDGVPYTSELLPNWGTFLGYSGVNNSQQSGNPLNYINPADIESISVLKDADATAIYGSRAANGAILITTKKGKAGATKVDFNLQNGWGELTRRLPLLNTSQYLEMRHEAIANDGLTTQPTDYDINGLWDTTRSTDWQKQLLGSTAQFTQLTGTVSGGNTNTQFLVGGTYNRQTTVFPGDFTDQKASMHFNINNISTDQRFRLQLSGSYLIDDNELPSYDITSTVIDLAPDAPPLYSPNGGLNWAPNGSGSSSWSNPVSYLYDTYENKTNNLVSNAVLSYAILPNLEIKSSFGYTNLQSNEIVGLPLIATAPENRPFTQRSARYSDNNIHSWIIEPQLRSVNVIGKGKLEVLVGSTIEQNNSNGSQLLGAGYNSDLVLGDIHSAATVTSFSSTSAVYKYNAGFARINYSLEDKYIIDLTTRRDGSSRFGPANQFHDFGAAGIAWIFSREDLVQKNFSFLSFGKLRSSFGTTGNDQIGDYQFMTLYSPTSVGVAYQGTTGLVPNGLSNPYLQWEETKKLQFGIDLGFLKDRISFNGNYFRNRSSNQLLNYALPNITGFESVTRNFPATVQNSGGELTLTTINIKSKNFNWTTRFNLTIPRNKLLAFPNLSSSSYASNLIIGQPINILKVYHFMGVNPTTGVYQFSDGHGGVTPTPDTNYQAAATTLIKTFPQFYGGFGNNLRYKEFELDLFFQFTKQKGLNYQFGNNPGGPGINQPTYVLKRWQKPGDITGIQRFNSDYSLNEEFADATFCDAAYLDASYIRLKNMSLSWHLPEAWEKKAHLQNTRLFIQGQNLLTITHYKGLDPETLSSSSLPPLRILTFGLQVSL